MMKRKIITIIIAIIMMILLNNNISEASYSDVLNIIQQEGRDTVCQTIPLKFSDMNTVNNEYIYCISQGQHNNSSTDTYYEILSYIEIKDGVAYVSSKDQNGVVDHKVRSSTEYSGNPDAEAVALANRTFAEIICGNYGAFGYGKHSSSSTTDKSGITDRQCGVWAYLSEWLSTLNMSCIDSSWYVDNGYDDSEFDGRGSQVITSARAAASTSNASARIYLLNPAEARESWQRLMIAVPGENTSAGLKIDKRDELTNGSLKGVQFNIRNDSGQYIVASGPNENNEYTVTGYTSNESEATIFSTGDSTYQTITVLGLAQGWYTIKEIGNSNAGFNTAENIGKEENVLVDANASASVTIYNKKDTDDDDDDDGESEELFEPTEVYAKVNISGYVWEDVPITKNGKGDNVYKIYDSQDQEQDIKLSGIKVNWRSGNIILGTTKTGDDGYYILTTTIKLQNHPYAEIDKDTYEMINNSYIEFEYNGIKYTTVAVNNDLNVADTSKGIEITSTRDSIDSMFNKVEDEKVYDANNNVTISNLPNASLTSDNYLDGYNATASTVNVVGKLLSKAESYNWTRKTTFCTQHCYICSCGADTCSSCESYKHLAHTAIESVRVDLPTFTKDTNKNGKIDETETETTKGTGVEEEDQALIDAGWIMTDDGLEDVTVSIYCNGEIEYTSADNNAYVSYLSDEQKNKYSELIGDQYNQANGGLHYYSAEEAYTTRKHCLAGEDHIVEWTIQNMNLGLIKREQPNTAIVSDVEKVRVIMKNQEYTYIYGNRGLSDVSAPQLKWQNKYDVTTYSRPVNPADVAYVNANNTNDLNVYVTYNIIAKNNSGTLPMTINKIVTYYDDDYTIFKGTGTATSQGWTEGGTKEGGDGNYKIAYSTLLAGKTLAPGTESEIIKIEFEVSQNAIKGLLNNKATLYTVSEIFSYSTFYGENTLCAEGELASAKGKTGQQYAGIDKNSTPGNAVPGNTDTYEDDTDKAPSFVLELAETPDETTTELEYKKLTGIVWEDLQTDDSQNANERLGNGKIDNGEKGIQNVKVELICAETGEVADLYGITDGGTVVQKEASVYTDANGYYTFGDDAYGVVVDNYILKYTYGNGQGIEDARNYKSTIIVDDVVKNVMEGNTIVDGQGNNITDKWHLFIDRTNDISVAVDDLKQRLETPSLKYDNFDSEEEMSAYTKPFKLQVEYTEESQQQMADADNDGIIEGTVYVVEGDQTATFESSLEGLNFGIIERAREDIVIEKTISKIRLTLANGQILIDGDPRIEKLNYVRAVGIYGVDSIRTREASINAIDKRLFIEMDAELIQGSILETWYDITVTNNSEYDYEYYAEYDDINQVTSFITNNPQAKYYYYGEGQEELDLIDSTVEIVADYIDSESICKVGDEADQNVGDKEVNNEDWHRYDSKDETELLIDPDNAGNQITAELLRDKGYIGAESETNAFDALTEGEYQIIVTDTFSDVTAKEGENSKTSTIYTSKLLASQEEDYGFENHVEILQLNGKIARTIDSVSESGEVEKTYKPGNYVPSLVQRVTDGDPTSEEAGLHQADDDRVTMTITPPTGTTNYITTYIITAVIGLIVIVGGVIFIKKKVISK